MTLIIYLLTNQKNSFLYIHLHTLLNESYPHNISILPTYSTNRSSVVCFVLIKLQSNFTLSHNLMETRMPTTFKQQGFTLIEVMMVIAVIGILASIAIPNFISYRNKAYCSDVESDANNLVASIADYFAIPAHDSISTGDQDFIPLNSYTITTDPNGVITIQVSDESNSCSVSYTNSNPVNPSGDGWLNNSTYQKTL